MDIDSDCESVYSSDSLEDDIGRKSVNCCTSTAICVKDTIPYYTGEIPVQCVKSSIDINHGNASDSSHSSKSPKVKLRKENTKEIKETNLQFGEKYKKQFVNRANSYISSDLFSFQSPRDKRISRRKALITQNKDSLRVRHRSVSYLEQFKKKYYGNCSLDSTGYSTAGSKLSDRDKSMSFVSCVSRQSSMSELEFYSELMGSPRNELQNWNKQSLQSSTLLTEEQSLTGTEEPVKYEKDLKNAKQKKVKPVILSRVEVKIQEQPNKDLDRKRSIEKKEVYAINVKLRNQMKINRQKEKEKKDKFQFSASHVFPDSSFKECLLQSPSYNVCLPLPDRTTSEIHPPKVPNKEKYSKEEKKSMGVGNEIVKKTKRTGVQQSKKKEERRTMKNKKAAELASLQERHEREKSLIESMKNLILKK